MTNPLYYYDYYYACDFHFNEASGWLRAWKAEGEMPLIRFIGSNKLPSNNPFALQPYFADISLLLSRVMSSGCCDELEAFVLAGLSAGVPMASKIKTALSLALFQEISLLYVLPDTLSPDQLRLKSNLEALRLWIAESRALSLLHPKERKLLLFFGGTCNRGVVQPRSALQIPAFHPSVEKLFSLHAGSNTESILVVRFLSHLAAAVMGATSVNPSNIEESEIVHGIGRRAAGTISGGGSAGPDNLDDFVTLSRSDGHPLFSHSLLSLFRTIILDPRTLTHTYFPTMPEDIRFMAQQVPVVFYFQLFRCP